MKNKRPVVRLQSMLLAAATSLHFQTVYFGNTARPDTTDTGAFWATAKLNTQNAIILATSGA